MDTSTVLTGQQRGRLARIRDREEAAFRARVPKSLALGSKARTAMPGGVPTPWMAGYYRTPPLWVAHGHGATFTDVDGHRYLDFNVCDMSAILGYAHPRLTQVIGEQAARGVQMFLPDESALAVCEQLRLRFGLPMWQFTLSASSANAEALRIARVATGRQGVLLFGGKYHGMLEETLWAESDDGTGLVPEELGVGAVAPADLAVVDFNDLGAAERVLRLGRTAAVLIEGVLTNCGTVLPEDGFLPGLREACTRYGTLLVMDETHTQFDRFGGAVSCYGMSPDMVTGGKGIGGGIPIGAYGMTTGLAALVESKCADETGNVEGIALGGTLFGNALSLACTEVVLTELMRPADYDRMTGLGGRLADGIEAAAWERGLDWRAHRFGARTGYCLRPELPRTAREAHASLDPLFTDTRRVYFANRGVWDAISSAGPHPGFSHEAGDVDVYLGVLHDFLDEMCAR
jgi:glutamate-1-semialdehyde 2,1-aminomutase